MQGDHIHVVLYPNQFEQFKDKLNIGNVYMISNVKVIPAQNGYRSLSRNKALMFHRKTNIKETGDDNLIPT